MNVYPPCLIPSFDHMHLFFCLTLHTNVHVAPEMFYLVCLLNKLVVRLLFDASFAVFSFEFY